MPDVKSRMDITSFYPWKEYDTTSKVYDLAILGLDQGFEVAKKELENTIDVLSYFCHEHLMWHSDFLNRE